LGQNELSAPKGLGIPPSSACLPLLWGQQTRCLTLISELIRVPWVCLCSPADCASASVVCTSSTTTQPLVPAGPQDSHSPRFWDLITPNPPPPLRCSTQPTPSPFLPPPHGGCRLRGACSACSAPWHVCTHASMSPDAHVALQVTMSLRFKTWGMFWSMAYNPRYPKGGV
jgi:hypothetical protein